ncbi:hypothetical protein CHARACLAT_001802 [Characodon lateralis]|uniref:Secreted protein n=1 Tax=Characodon lateralis TaxID=208331 RepID=A0ABU7DFV0_9TELE|nr:hypothetical protein [Characodon lateralis]
MIVWWILFGFRFQGASWQLPVFLHLLNQARETIWITPLRKPRPESLYPWRPDYTCVLAILPFTFQSRFL